jgi:hypothetical protein
MKKEAEYVDLLPGYISLTKKKYYSQNPMRFVVRAYPKTIMSF